MSHNLKNWKQGEVREGISANTPYEVKRKIDNEMSFLNVPLTRFTHDELDAAKVYSSSKYIQINATLRSGNPLDREAKQIVSHLDSAISKSPEFPKPITVWRGLKFQTKHEMDQLLQRFQNHLESQRHWTQRAYTSTSMSPSIAGKFARKSMEFADPMPFGIIIEIKAKRGLMTEQVLHRSFEQEIILPRNSELVIKEIRPERIRNNRGQIQEFMFVKMEQL